MHERNVMVVAAIHPLLARELALPLLLCPSSFEQVERVSTAAPQVDPSRILFAHLLPSPAPDILWVVPIRAQLLRPLALGGIAPVSPPAAHLYAVLGYGLGDSAAVMEGDGEVVGPAPESGVDWGGEKDEGEGNVKEGV
ncbi:hypothetical protein A1Q1_01704 [Trichosporon asahii var. asahii CBS 2479]|uniref:Uncharacterized protein n=1 Tax=Trichosporon asahii var. asahii (strain ATCC 90039 / CBS 2479 / JCM 2466 / KCTC 7840 / NBRC 103889/ NCYC 2677 / UAMH 7654) TaxID=1186058 RepID=J5QUT9_TRIAS|nr:hypothetical protein A1Q1_01704 [Trichosporon asahii var. asahii CBS 2479]EJT49223.1 hypothetical protein A1Q1_01704 [Trichosporon asahii var. asahii CBS 2479]